MRLCINLSRILNGAQSSEMGLYDLGYCAGLFGFGRATTVARRQVFGILHLRKHDVKNEHSQAVVFALWWITNSGWMIVASWCFTRLQLCDGCLKFFYCKVGRHVGIGGDLSRKRSDYFGTGCPFAQRLTVLCSRSIIPTLGNNPSLCAGNWSHQHRWLAQTLTGSMSCTVQMVEVCRAYTFTIVVYWTSVTSHESGGDLSGMVQSSFRWSPRVHGWLGHICPDECCSGNQPLQVRWKLTTMHFLSLSITIGRALFAGKRVFTDRLRKTMIATFQYDSPPAVHHT